MLLDEVMSIVNTIFLMYIIYDIQNIKRTQQKLEVKVARLEAKQEQIEKIVNKLLNEHYKT